MMRAVLVLLFALCVVAVQDFKCLKKCAKSNQAIKAANAANKKKHVKKMTPLKNCLHLCELTNKRAFAKRVVSKKVQKKKALAKKKGLIKHVTHVVGRSVVKHPKKHLTPLQRKLIALRKEVSEEEKERRQLLAEMRGDEEEVNKERVKDKHAHVLEKEDKALLAELRKLSADRAKLSKITHEEMAHKLEEKLDEHGQKLGKTAKKQPMMKHWLARKISAKSGYACLRGCLLALHNVPACKKRCNLSKKQLAKKKQRAAEEVAKKEVAERAAWKAGCGPCYGAKPKGQCCATCLDVKKAYAAKRWALPALSRLVQCAAQKRPSKKTLAKKNLHSRIFRGTTSRGQHQTNKVIHKLLFKHLARRTAAKGHFKPKKFSPKKSKIAQKQKAKKMLKIIKKWDKYHRKRWAGKHAKVAPTFLKHLKSAHKVREAAPVLRQQGMMLHMTPAQLKKWQLLKIHSWTSKAHKSVLKAKVRKAKHAALKAAKKHPELKKQPAKKH